MILDEMDDDRWCYDVVMIYMMNYDEILGMVLWLFFPSPLLQMHSFPTNATSNPSSPSPSPSPLLLQLQNQRYGLDGFALVAQLHRLLS